MMLTSKTHTSLFGAAAPGRDGPAAFIDAPSAEVWTAQLPFDDPLRCNQLLLGELSRIHLLRLHSADRLEMLEVLRGVIMGVQEACGQLCLNCLAPLTAPQKALVGQVLALWQVTSAAYEHCLKTWSNKERDELTRPKALHRALDALARSIAEYYSAYRSPAESLFTSLHALYGIGERLGLLEVPIKDPQRVQATTCARDAYVYALLLDSCLPRQYSDKEFAVTRLMLERWAGRVRIVMPGAPAGEDSAPPFVVDLQAPRGLSTRHDRPVDLRVLDMSGLATALRRALSALHHGAEPGAAGLAPGLNRREYEVLLLSLYQQWCDGGIKRQHERQASDSHAHVSNGLVAAHFYLSRQPFHQPNDPVNIPQRGVSTASEHKADRIRVATEYLQVHRIHAEQWRIQDESITGLGMMRPAVEAGDSWLCLGLLLSVRPRGLNNTLLGTIQWLEEARQGDIFVGVRLLPGIPAPIAARRMGVESFEPAVLLLPLPAVNAPSSILLVTGRFEAQTVIEIWREGIDRIHLTGLLESSGGFDRFAFMPAGSVYDPANAATEI